VITHYFTKTYPIFGYIVISIMIIWSLVWLSYELDSEKGRHKLLDFLIKLVFCLGIFLLGYSIAINYHKVLMEKIH
jgi:hypothetical protein